MDIRFSSRLGWPAPGNSLTALREWRRDRGQPVLDFSESNPTKVGLSPTRLDSFLDPENLSYEPNPKGLLRAREALAAEYAGRFGERLLVPTTYSSVPRLPRPTAGFSSFSAIPATRSSCRSPAILSSITWPASKPSRPGPIVSITSSAGMEHRSRFGPNGPGGRKGQGLVTINPNNPTGSYIRRKRREALYRPLPAPVLRDHRRRSLLTTFRWRSPPKARRPKASFIARRT